MSMVFVEEGTTPELRSIWNHIRSGVINLDKPPKIAATEVAAWTKNILGVSKAVSGYLEPEASGCLTVCIDRATRIVKFLQYADRSYIAGLRLYDQVPLESLRQICSEFVGPVFQRHDKTSAVRIRIIKDLNLIEYDKKKKLALLEINCQADTYIRTLCVHIGLILGVGGVMFDLRHVRSGLLDENTNLATMHDILDAHWLFKTRCDERYLRKIIIPLEYFLVKYKRIVVKESAVGALCYGASLYSGGVVCYDKHIRTGEEILLVSTKGEAVAIAIATCSMERVPVNESYLIANLKRVIMDRDNYRRQWRSKRNPGDDSSKDAVKRPRLI